MPLEKLKRIIKDIALKLFFTIFKSKFNNSNISLNNNENLLLIIFEDISHALQTTPLIQLLGESHAKLTVLTNQYSKDIFKGNNSILEIIVFEKDLKSFIKILKMINSKSFQTLINTNESFNYLISFLIGLVKIKIKIGFKNLDEKLYTHLITTPNKIKNHKVDRILSLLTYFNVNYNKKDLNILFDINTKTKQIVENFLIENQLKDKYLVGINISSIDNNSWGVDNYKSLVKYFRNYEIKIIILAETEEMDIAKEIAGKEHIIYFNTELKNFAAIIKATNFLISPKSYVIHLASAFNIPIFCLFHQFNKTEMLDIPYKSDFDFALTEDEKLERLTFGNMLNNFIPFFENYYSDFEKRKLL